MLGPRVRVPSVAIMSVVKLSVSPDEYLRGILEREAIDASMRSPLRRLQADIAGYAERALPEGLLGVHPTGAFERGTGNRSGTAIDFLVSYSPRLALSARALSDAMFVLFDQLGYEPRRRDLATTVVLKGVRVDIVAGRREAMTTDVHEFWVERSQRTIKTNLTQHVLDVAASGLNEEIRVLKLWRDQLGLDFPSFYLELSAIAAMRRRPRRTLAENVWAVLGYLETLFPARSILDPVNANNIVSDHLTAAQKDAIRRAAQYARKGRAWSEIVR